LGAFSSGQLSAFAQANQWASCLANAPLNRLQSLYPGLTAVADLDTIQKAARIASGARGVLTMRTALGLVAGFDASFEGTRLKLSAFAGVSSVYGLDSSATVAAYQSVFGNWRTRPDLPPRFWRDPSVRHRMYEEAEVDPGLVSAEIDTALEVAVESGLTGGFRSETSTVAIISVGAFSMSIRSNNTRVDAYHALGAFEEQLRSFIARKLSEKAGPGWFKQRVSGDIGGKAKDTREAAVRQGEAPGQLIDYTDLGELCRIVRASNNWSEVFEPVFINGNEFQHDMQRLVATRRPTAHYRKLDGVRLLELLCVVDRLIKRMENDGAWKDAIESEE
jgi:hypothetical protein